MEIYQLLLIIAGLLCSLVAGFLFAFAVVVMPGITTLPDRDFIRAFQVMDRVIQNNQPLFMLAWAGSVVALLAAAVVGWGQFAPTARALMVVATVGYLVGVQLPTGAINVPLNNQLQALDAAGLTPEALSSARRNFEGRWNSWNRARTIVSVAVTATLLLLLLRV